VLLDGQRAVARPWDSEHPAAVHLRFAGVDDFPQHREPADLRDVAVEIVIAADRLVKAVARERHPVAIDDVLEVLLVLIAHQGGSARHALAFERDANDVRFFDLRPVDLGNKRTGLSKHVDEALVAELLDGLTDRRA
jgi:hypothetical protein